MENKTSLSHSSPLFETLNNNEVTISLLVVNIIILFIGFSALSLNAVVLDTLVTHTKVASDLIMCHLAVTDMLTGVLVIYMAIYNIVYFQNVIDHLVRLGAVFTFLTSSVYHLALLTVDRFVKIVFPYRYEYVMTKNSVSVVSTVIWVFSVNLGLLPAYGWRKPSAVSHFAFVLVMADDYLKLLIVVFHLPLILIVCLYGKISIVARRHARAIDACQADVRRRGEMSKSWKFTQAVAIIIGTYICMFLPTSLVIFVYLLDVFHDRSPLDIGDYIIYTSTTAFLNSAVNPVIYAFKLPLVRRRFMAMLGRKGTTSDFPNPTPPPPHSDAPTTPIRIAVIQNPTPRPLQSESPSFRIRRPDHSNPNPRHSESDAPTTRIRIPVIQIPTPRPLESESPSFRFRLPDLSN